MSVSRSISLSEANQLYLATYLHNHPTETYSSIVAKAIRALQDQEVREGTGPAHDEWVASGEAALWDTTVDDGLERRERDKAIRHA